VIPVEEPHLASVYQGPHLIKEAYRLSPGQFGALKEREDFGSERGFHLLGEVLCHCYLTV
jgi:hypothetical protein